LLLLLLVTLSSAPAPDPCAGVLPPVVLSVVGKAYPGFRVVRGSDYSAEDLGWAKDDDHPCPGIASNDVDADGTTDYAFFLLSGKGDAFLASARVPAGAKVRVGRLMNFGSRGLGRSFVYPLDPGKYADMYAAASAPIPPNALALVPAPWNRARSHSSSPAAGGSTCGCPTDLPGA
jgi:hypothetical protein